MKCIHLNSSKIFDIFVVLEAFLVFFYAKANILRLFLNCHNKNLNTMSTILLMVDVHFEINHGKIWKIEVYMLYNEMSEICY